MKKFSNYFELAARWYVFLLLNTYGFGKLLGGQFYRKDNLPEEVAIQTLGNANSFDLAWTFMGHSNAYIAFIAASQIIGAFLLVFERTKFIGIVILIPILINIIVFDAIFFETYGALGSATLYLTLLFIVLLLNKKKVIQLIRLITSDLRAVNQRIALNITSIVAVLVMISLLFGMDQLIVNILGH